MHYELKKKKEFNDPESGKRLTLQEAIVKWEEQEI